MITPAPRQPDHPVDPMFPGRWSPRAFSGEPMDEAALRSLLEAARWAPSANNAQPWRFIFGRTGTPAFAPILAALVPFNRDWAQHASALVVVLSATRWVPPGKTEPQPLATHAFDTGAAWASLALQAHLSGWITHGMGGFDGAALRAALGIPEDHAVHAVVAVGRPGDATRLPAALQAREAPNDRRPQATFVAEGRFGF